MPLYLYDATRLLVRGGNLATSQACCCNRCTSDANCTGCQVCHNGFCKTPTVSFAFNTTVLNEGQTFECRVITNLSSATTTRNVSVYLAYPIELFPNQASNDDFSSATSITTPILSTGSTGVLAFSTRDDATPEYLEKFQVCCTIGLCKYCSSVITINESDLVVCCVTGSCTMKRPVDCGGTIVTGPINCYYQVCYGACCHDFGCAYEYRERCLSSIYTNSVFLGETVPCDPCKGACCKGTTCTQEYRGFCVNSGGTFYGRGTSCATTACVCENRGTWSAGPYGDCELADAITITNNLGGQATLTVTGSADDDVIIGGQLVLNGRDSFFGFPGRCSNQGGGTTDRASGAHSFTYSATLNAGASVKITCQDNSYGGTCSGSYILSRCPNPLP